MTAFDETIAKYRGDIHGYGSLRGLRLQRELPVLLVEANVSGGFWLSSHATVDAALAYHDGQEYAADWKVEALVDHVAGVEYAVQTTATPKVSP